LKVLVKRQRNKQTQNGDDTTQRHSLLCFVISDWTAEALVQFLLFDFRFPSFWKAGAQNVVIINAEGLNHQKMD